jgi:ABC-type dipeptide/oligopeptide/nickel transport system permease component
MAGLLVRRLASALLLVYLVLTATFFLLHAAPGAPGLVPEDPRIPAAQRAHLARVYGLDRPLPEQYVRFLAAMTRGEWGTSFHYHRPVLIVLAEAIPATLLLGLAALAVEYGRPAARRRRSAMRRRAR